VRTAIAATPALLTPFIEEVMRLHPPEPMLRHRTNSDVELGSTRIAAETDVYLCLAAANRDPRRYADPSALRLDRTETPALICGHGIYDYISATLARTTVITAVQALLTRYPRFRAAQKLESVQRCTTMMTHHIESLLIGTTRSYIRPRATAPGECSMMERVASDGYAVVEDFLAPADIAALMAAFRSLDSPVHHRAFGVSMFSSDLTYRAAVDRAIKAAIAPRAAALLPEYRICFCNFLVKEPCDGAAGIVQIHQDPTFVDENRYDSLLLWIPLVDTDAENGAITVLPGSHLWNQGPRSYGGTLFPYLDLMPMLLKHAQIVPMKAGAALAFSQKTFHGSPTNRAQQARITVAALLVPRDAQLRAYHANPALPGKLEVFEIDDAFYSRYPYGTRPEGVPRIEVVDHWHEPIEPEQFSECNKAHREC
jgi:hypothetical protein